MLPHDDDDAEAEDYDDDDDDADDDDDDEDFNVAADAAIIAAVEIVNIYICISLPLLLLMPLYRILLSSAASTADVVTSDTAIIVAASDVYMHSATTQSLPLKHIYIRIKLDCMCS